MGGAVTPAGRRDGGDSTQPGEGDTSPGSMAWALVFCGVRASRRCRCR
jgi:hypothetical protein